MFEVREVLRLWLAGEGIRSVERSAQVDRKTVRRYGEMAVRLQQASRQMADVLTVRMAAGGLRVEPGRTIASCPLAA